MNTDQTKPLMGTLAWAKKSNGQLTDAEKIKLSKNVASLQAEMIFDEFRNRLGLIKTAPIDIDLLLPVDSKLVRNAEEFARELYDDVLWNHCMRSYYFGALVAAFEGIGYDRELFYTAAICHDTGANQDAGGLVRNCCFAHSGGQLTHDHLLINGHSDHIATSVGDAISTHMNLYVPISEYPAISTLTAIGATCDVMGAYARRIDAGTLGEVVNRWPRAGLSETFGAFLGSKHMDNSRTDTLVSMGAFASNGPNLIDTILATS
jgi:hypothetical protein